MANPVCSFEEKNEYWVGMSRVSMGRRCRLRILAFVFFLMSEDDCFLVVAEFPQGCTERRDRDFYFGREFVAFIRCLRSMVQDAVDLPAVTAACPYPALRLDKLYAALIRCLVLWTVTKQFLVFLFKGLYLLTGGSDVTRGISCDSALH